MSGCPEQYLTARSNDAEALRLEQRCKGLRRRGVASRGGGISNREKDGHAGIVVGYHVVMGELCAVVFDSLLLDGFIMLCVCCSLLVWS